MICRSVSSGKCKRKRRTDPTNQRRLDADRLPQLACCGQFTEHLCGQYASSQYPGLLFFRYGQRSPSEDHRRNGDRDIQSCGSGCGRSRRSLYNVGFCAEYLRVDSGVRTRRERNVAPTKALTDFSSNYITARGIAVDAAGNLYCTVFATPVVTLLSTSFQRTHQVAPRRSRRLPPLRGLHRLMRCSPSIRRYARSVRAFLRVRRPDRDVQ